MATFFGIIVSFTFFLLALWFWFVILYVLVSFFRDKTVEYQTGEVNQQYTPEQISAVSLPLVPTDYQLRNIKRVPFRKSRIKRKFRFR